MEDTGYIVDEGGPIEFKLLQSMKKKYDNEELMLEEIKRGEIKAGIVFHNNFSYEIYCGGENGKDLDAFIKEELKKYNNERIFTRYGIVSNATEEVQNMKIESEVINTSKYMEGKYIILFLIALGFFIMNLSGSVFFGKSLVLEKEKHIFETILVHMRPRNLLFGKWLSGAVAGAVQLGIWTLTAILAYTINRNHLEDLTTIWGFNFSINNILLVVLILYLSYLFYLSAFGLYSAFLQESDQVTYLLTPFTMILLISYSIANIGLQNPVNPIVETASLFPLSSSLTMTVRILFSKVSPITVLIALIILLSLVVVFLILASLRYKRITIEG